MSFHVGQKVVCVRDGWQPYPGDCLPPHCPKAGSEYTIRAIVTCHPLSAGLRLHWLINPTVTCVVKGVIEPSFAVFGLDGIANFRPVIERKTDISVFKRAPVPTEKVDA